MKFIVSSTNKLKRLKSPVYNFIFNRETGLFVRWGETKDDDPSFSPIGPEILDIEITSGGLCKGGCSFCYKANGGNEPVNNMSFDTYVQMFNKFPKMLTQIAFGLMNIDSNPDLVDIMEFTAKGGVVPNYTCHGLDTSPADAAIAAELCGGIAVSVLDKEKTYNSIKLYSDMGCKQVNIHYMISEETYDKAFEIVEDISNDTRLEGLRAIVFLQYKPKGRGTQEFHSISDVDKFKKLTEFCDEKKVNYGFDSCSSPMVMKSMEHNSNKDSILQFIEPCESTLFSGYINWRGEFFPCSFVEGTPEWETGLNILECDNFVTDIWNHPRVVSFRQSVVRSSEGCNDCEFVLGCRKCIVYDCITNCEGVNYDN